MNNFQVGKRVLAWSYVTQLFQYGSSILILPVILNRLPTEEMAIWYVFISISTVAGLFDFGFSPSLSKQVSFVYSGVDCLYKDGVENTNTNNTINLSLLNDLYKTCVLLYRNIALAAGGLMLSIGSLYLYYALETSSQETWIAWFLYVLSLIYNIYYNFILVFIRGRGLVKENNQLIIISKAIYIIVLFILILYGLGLLSLVISNFLSTFTMRMLGRKYVLSNDEIKELKSYKTFTNLTPIIWHNAKRYGITSLGVILLAQSNIFLGGIFLSLEETGQLGLTIQIYTIFTVIAKVPLSAYMPKISSLFVTKNTKLIKKYFIKCQLINYLVYFICSIVLIFAGNYILANILHSNTLLPNRTILLLYFFFYSMELTHGNCVTVISAENKVPFYKASIISGIISIIVSSICLYLGLAIYSFPIGLISGSLPYNSWKWPVVLYKRLNND